MNNQIKSRDRFGRLVVMTKTNKKDMSLAEFKEHIIKIYKFLLKFDD